WANVERAQMLTRQASSLRSQIEPWQILRSQVSDIIELMDLGDDSMLVEFTEQLAALEAEYQERRKDLLFSGEYDNRAAILKLSAGAGGTDAQDWAEMLERMYLRWAEKHDMQTELVERSTGEEAGIKNATYIIRGAFAYGKLRSEHGVHRLVRLSPFNADNLRQTSFALVEIMPEMDAPGEVEIDDKDLRIDIYRSGGNGGQGVNTTDSAVRITHLPTGTVVAIQNERSQLQNKETALKILKSRLAQMQLEQRAETLADLRAGESASWGAQIRNYVLHPYTLVKDTRTKFETHNARGVLDGDIDGFIEAYLEQQAATE
ncbi:peptide chain release factor 2, partial [Candidatus Saccharibacteria bacterium]|nr:peptide chain release factor 2 [Candidatus Saccharibacteria bacterium]